MNILHVESSLNWGGQEYRTLAEAQWLNKRGHQAWIACNQDSELFRRAAELAVPVRMRASIDPRASGALARMCRQHAIDVIHVHSPKDAWLCSPLHAVGVPVVRSRQITNPVKKKWSRSVIYRRGCAHIIATAECIRRDLVARNGVAAGRISVVGEGVDLAEFHPGLDGGQFRTEFGVQADELLFGIVAMIRPEKGHLTLLEAAENLLATHPRARVAIVGEGTGARETELAVRQRLIARYGTDRTGAVFMTGYRNDTPAVFAGLDVLVVPSTAEAQSLVVPQAFATERAVIASEVGGLPELVRHGETGLLVPPGNPAALAEAMRRLVDDPVLRHQLARGGLDYARRHLSFERKMEESIAIYDAVAAPRSHRASTRAAPARPLAQRRMAFRGLQASQWTAAVVGLVVFAFVLGGLGWKPTGGQQSEGIYRGGMRVAAGRPTVVPPPAGFAWLATDDDDDQILPVTDDDILT